MIKEIVKDTNILTQKSEPFNFETDFEIIQDLLDTAHANIDNCVGLAAPQIGVLKRIIVIKHVSGFIPLINPIIYWKDIKSSYYTDEGCLSVDGEHRVKRFRKIKIKYLNERGQEINKMVEGYPAQIIQHEIDHLNGILI